MEELQFKGCIMPLHKTLYAFALSILHDEHDAADCLQETFTRLWENRHRLADVGNVRAYAIVTVKNIAISMAAHRPQQVATIDDEPPDIPDSSPTPHEKLANRENLQTMKSMLQHLPESQRKVVLLSGVAGLSNTEIGKATGLSDENVRVLLSRGRKKLRNLFSKQ